jgi:hypothetical protein
MSEVPISPKRFHGEFSDYSLLCRRHHRDDNFRNAENPFAREMDQAHVCQ